MNETLLSNFDRMIILLNLKETNFSMIVALDFRIYQLP